MKTKNNHEESKTSGGVNGNNNDDNDENSLIIPPLLPLLVCHKTQIARLSNKISLKLSNRHHHYLDGFRLRNLEKQRFYEL